MNVARRPRPRAGGLALQGVSLARALAGRLAAGEVFWSVAAFGVPLLLYLRTVAPTVYGLDSAELTTGAYALGIVHPPGSPLYLLIGHLFTWIPLGDVGYRLNLMSACAAALAAFFLYRVLLHLTGRRGISLASAWLLAASYYIWVSAVAAELYALHAAFVAGLLWLALVYRAQGRGWQLCLLALLYGLGLGNHTSLVLLAPGFALLVLTAPRPTWRRPRVLAAVVAVVAAGLLGLSVYLYLPLRHLANPSLDYARDYWSINLATWSGFWWMISARPFESLFFSVPLAELPGELWRYGHRLWSNFLGLGLLLGLVGLAAGVKRQPALHLALLAMFVAHLVFYLTYAAVDKELMFLPTYLIWAIWLGVGGCLAQDACVQRFGSAYRALLPITLALLAVSALAVNYPLVDLSQDWSARSTGEQIFAGLEDQAVYFGTWRDIPILEYLQQVERQRPDVQLVNVFATPKERAIRIASERLRAGYPVYTSSALLLDDADFEYAEHTFCSCSGLQLPGEPTRSTSTR
jgi:hypothetical protein